MSMDTKRVIKTSWHMSYDYGYVPIQPNTNGGADPQNTAQDCVRERNVLSRV